LDFGWGSAPDRVAAAFQFISWVLLLRGGKGREGMEGEKRRGEWIGEETEGKEVGKRGE